MNWILSFIWYLHSIHSQNTKPDLVYETGVRWYLPFHSFNDGIKLNGILDSHLIISNQLSIAGLNIQNGQYFFNTTLKDPILCTFITNHKLITLHESHYGTWDVEGMGKDWIDISYEAQELVNPHSQNSNYCDIFVADPGSTLVLRNGDNVVVIDENGGFKWKWLSKKKNYIFSKLAFDDQYVYVIGQENDLLVIIQLDRVSGNVVHEINQNILLGTTKPQFFIVGESPVFVLWVTDDHVLLGYNLVGHYVMTFDVFIELDDFQHTPKRIITLDVPSNRKSSFIIEYNSNDYILVELEDPEDPTIVYHSIASTPSTSHFFFRDNDSKFDSLSRAYLNEFGKGVFEILDPEDGEVLQQFAMSQQFQSYVVEGYLHTWMIDDDYFDWALIGKDNQGGYVSHRSQSSLNAEFKPDSHLDEESNMGPEIVTEDASSSNDKNAHDEL